MLKTSLFDYRYTQPWADEIITHVESPPAWLCDLATKRYQGDQIKILQEFISCEPFEPSPVDMEKFAVACLWIRYERRELSWAIFLAKAGEILDACSSDWDCETPYHYLNVYKDAYFTPVSEEKTKEAYFKDHDLHPWIKEAKSRFAPFLELRMQSKGLRR
jgi:hypothetical protein